MQELRTNGGRELGWGARGAKTQVSGKTVPVTAGGSGAIEPAKAKAQTDLWWHCETGSIETEMGYLEETSCSHLPGGW